MKSKRAIVWFQSDLRLHDNEALLEAVSAAESILPVYVFDPRVLTKKTIYGFDKVGALRLQFLIDSVNSLRNRLQSFGLDLAIRIGAPEDEIYQLAQELKTNFVFCNRERTQEELDVQEKLEENLWSIGQELRYARGKMLFYTQDLPFPITQAPSLFSTFKKETERFVPIRKCLSSEASLDDVTLLESEYSELPTMEDFGKSMPSNSQMAVSGGEEEALTYLSKITTNDVSQKQHLRISAWLANGCLSPKAMYHKAMEVSTPKKTKILVRNLFLRDFHRLMGKKFKEKLFLTAGLSGKGERKPLDISVFEAWQNGQTENSFINACMRELKKTGFISHQKRKAVAYYFIEDLGQPWKPGAAYFESMLLDYDPCSNYGNWQRIAGISSDQKGEVRCQIDTIKNKLDPSGDFVKEWVISH